MGADLTTLKPYVLLLYAAFGTACLWLAAASAGPGLAADGRTAGRIGRIGTTLVVLAAATLLASLLAAGSLLLVAACTIAALVHIARPEARATPATLFGGLATAVVVLSLVWWRMGPSDAAPVPLAVFTAVLVGLVIGLADPGRPARRLVAVWIGLFTVAGLALVADLGTFGPGHSAVVFLVHHWGAFLGPVLHVRAGLVPFYDVPLQYGLGPTLALAASCGDTGCWRGAHLLFAGTDVVAAIVVLAMALTTSVRRGWPWTLAVTLVVFAAVFMWPGFPAEGNILMATPSVGGMRFLPVTIIAGLWFFGRPRAATAAMIPAVLWSPESAAMSVTVFGLCGTAHFGFRKAALLTAALLVGSYGVLVLAHRAIYGLWLDPLALVEYVLHVPGPLPINPFSDILLLAVVLGLGGWLVFDAKTDPLRKRRDLAVTALLFAAASYSFGRSHPNNICNLAPFLVLVGLRALDRPTEALGAAGKAAALGLAVSVAAIAFSPWNVLPYDPHVVTDIRQVVAGFPDYEPNVGRIRGRIPVTPALGIADFGPHYARHPSETIVWTPMDPSSLWTSVPSERRKLYIARSARRLGRSGWGIFTDHARFFLDDLASAYDIRDLQSVEGAPEKPGEPASHYTVACFDPKPGIAATRVGPACPPETDGSLAAALAP